jgi:2'-5' RNA ligase
VRLFVALDVSAETRAQLRRVREAIEPKLQGKNAPRLTWVAEPNAHVTLQFIGEVGPDVGERVRAALSPPIRQQPFEIAFAGLGVFPNSRRPRVVWIGASETSGATSTLAGAVRNRLEPIVGRGEERDFRPHLTIARVKEAGRFDWDGVLSGVDAGGSVVLVDHVTLYQSRTSPHGPTYTALATTPLLPAEN